MPSRQRLLSFAFLLNFVLFGVSMTLVGATLPRAIRAFGWDYTVSGVVLSAGAAGYFCAAFLAGFLIERVGPRPVVVAGLCLEAVGLCLFARHPSPWINVALNALVGIGHGCGEVVTNYGAIQMESSGEGRFMSFLHAVFCLGAILGPLAVGAVLHATERWRLVFPLVAAPVAAMAVWFAALRFPETATAGGPRSPHGSGRRSFPAILTLLTFMLFLYVAAEIGASNWIAELFVREIEVSASVGALMVSLLWAGVFAGRMAVAVWYRGSRQHLLILGMSSLSALALSGLLTARGPAVAGGCVFLAGLGFSGVYPMVMTLVGRHCRGGAAVGVASAGGGIGSFLFPFLIGFVGDRAGLRGGFVLCVCASVALAVAAAVIPRLSRSR